MSEQMKELGEAAIREGFHEYGNAIISLLAKLDAERKLATGYYGEAQEGWGKFRVAESRIKELETRLEAARKLLDELETFEHREDPSLSVIDSKGYQLIEEVGLILGDEGPEKAAEAMARVVERQRSPCSCNPYCRKQKLGDSVECKLEVAASDREE